jgi:hypothetical protein
MIDMRSLSSAGRWTARSANRAERQLADLDPAGHGQDVADDVRDIIRLQKDLGRSAPQVFTGPG